MAGMNIVGVQFRRAGKIYDFDAKDFLLSIGDKVVVETERGPSLAEVMRVNFFDVDERKAESLKPIVRIATRKDLESSGRLTAEHAMGFAKEKIKKLELDMHVINVEIQFGGNKVIIYFSAPGRVDFRELVKELAGGLKTRVELKQVGARDEAKLAGGIGICGREFCCSSFLREFVPVSIKMAKNQNLALNPSKVSGGCGRLLCCLTYEDEIYTELRQKLLPKGTRVRLEDDTLADVIKGDILNQLMLVECDNGEQRHVPVNELVPIDAKAAVTEDWAENLDFDALLGSDEDIAALDDSEQIRKRREESQSVESEINYTDSTVASSTQTGRRDHRSRGEQRSRGDQAQRPPREARKDDGSGQSEDRQGRSKRPHRNQRNRPAGPRNEDGGQSPNGPRRPPHQRSSKKRPPDGNS
ncbi:MAG: regulatory iron-sulfur-containing complex subunit RicT [Oligoflexus sp.]